MRALAIAFIFSGLASCGAAAQAPPPSETTGSQGSLASGTTINAELNSSLDSKKVKAGEAVAAHTTEVVKSSDGRTILPRGTKLIGHVTQASARSNGDGEATLALQFDKAELKGGQEMPLNNVMIQALAAPSAAASSLGSDTDRTATQGTPSNNPSMSGSRGARPESTPTTQPFPTANPDGTPRGESNATGPLPANTRGVYGLQGVRLSTAASGNGEISIVSSSGKNLRLDGGTRLLLVVQPERSAAAPAN
jgi:hypothetical protein